MKDAHSLLNIRTKTDLQKSECELGCRYSVLLKLPYFDAPECIVTEIGDQDLELPEMTV